jgi:hypothetical protein
MRNLALSIEPRPEFYVSYQQNPWRDLPPAPYTTLVGRAMALVIRAGAEPTNLTAA